MWGLGVGASLALIIYINHYVNRISNVCVCVSHVYHGVALSL